MTNISSNQLPGLRFMDVSIFRLILLFSCGSPVVEARPDNGYSIIADQGSER